MHFLYALIAVLALVALGLAAGASDSLRFAITIFVPYVSLVIFFAGLIHRVWLWARVSVPFRIPTTCGQQKSLPWIKPGRLESPSTAIGTMSRMALEVLTFRSLFRNNSAQLREDGKIVFGEDKFLWLGALAFHWSLLILLLRHLRFFLEPVPEWVLGLERVDGFFQVNLPVIYFSDAVVCVALAYLLARRLRIGAVRYVSLFSDYYALCLIAAIVTTGGLMRYFVPVDVRLIKELALGLASFSPRVPAGAGALFMVHIFLVSALLAYFPFSKLMHMGGIFLSPTRNLASNNRMKRHVNPWDQPVKVHTYSEWEEEFRDKIKAAGLPLEGQ